MSWNAERQTLCIGVVGCGTMGRGIAQIAAQAGIRVRLFDQQPGAVAAARAAIGEVLQRLLDKGRITPAALQDALACLQPADSLAALAECDLVVEAIVERLEVKRELLVALEAVLREDAILASNTSSLSVTAMAAACQRPGRVAGWHFFNPVPLMKIVEVVAGTLTESWVCDTLLALARRLGHTGVLARDLPGFIVNHAGRGFAPEGLRILSEGVADVQTVDRILRDVAGFRMGPFELTDLIGLDVSLAVMDSIYEQFYHEPRFKPSALARAQVAAGLYGRKTGRGFYVYAEGAPVLDPEPALPHCEVADWPPVWISNAEPDLAQLLRQALQAVGARLEQGSTPSADALILLTPLGQDVTSAALAQGLDARRALGVDCLFAPLRGLDQRRTLMASPATAPAMRDAAHAMLGAGGVPVSLIRDSAGFVAQRIVAQIISVGCDIAQQRVASPADIDLGVRLGLGYPMGPLAMGDALGPRRVLGILEQMLAITGDPRCRPSPWLRRRALLGLSLLSTD